MAFPLDHPTSLLLMQNETHFPHFPSLSLFLFFLEIGYLLRAATAMETQSPGLQPIIRKENGMNRKASFHWEMTKYRHIMDTQAEVERCRDINWPAVGDGILWSHSGSPRMMAGRRYTAPTVSSPLRACIHKQRFYIFLWLQMHKHVNGHILRVWLRNVVRVCKEFTLCYVQNLILWSFLNFVHIFLIKV